MWLLPIKNHASKWGVAGCILGILSSIALPIRADPKPFAYTYEIKTHFGFLPITGLLKQTLTEVGAGFIFVVDANILGFGAVTESSFIWENGRIYVRSYADSGRGIFQDKTVRVQFDAQSRQSSIDPAAMALQLAQDLQKNPQQQLFMYQTYNGKSRKKVTFRNHGMETKETLVATFQTVKLEVLFADPVRKEYFWLIPKLEYRIAVYYQLRADGSEVLYTLKKINPIPIPI